MVEHHLIQDDGDGTRFVGEPVVDTYGGSWIVSERPDGSRLIVDLARREMTGVERQQGTYWTVSFDQLAQLQARMARTEEPTAVAGEPGEPVPIAGAGLAASSKQGATALAISEIAVAAADSRVARLRSGGSSSSVASSGLRHLSVGPSSVAATAGTARPAATLEVWVDSGLRLPPAALDAMEALEAGVFAAPGHGPARRAPVPTAALAASTSTAPGADAASVSTAPGRYLAAARRHAGGAFPVRTVRPVLTLPDGSTLGRIEDVALRLERLDRFPSALAEIPEGLKRVPHPLEAVVRFLEEDAIRNAALAGLGPAGVQDEN